MAVDVLKYNGLSRAVLMGERTSGEPLPSDPHLDLARAIVASSDPGARRLTHGDYSRLGFRFVDTDENYDGLKAVGTRVLDLHRRDLEAAAIDLAPHLSSFFEPLSAEQGERQIPESKATVFQAPRTLVRV